MRFKVVHDDGTEWSHGEVRRYVVENDLHLVYFDMLPFLIDEEGLLYLADECGNYEPADMDVFKVIEVK